jgi:hypothetical protein
MDLGEIQIKKNKIRENRKTKHKSGKSGIVYQKFKTGEIQTKILEIQI